MQDKYEDANKWKKTLSEQGCAFIAKRIAKHILATATPQQSQPAPPLIQAVLAGEPEKVCEMLVRGEKPNLVDQWGRTALFYAEETRDRNGGSSRLTVASGVHAAASRSRAPLPECAPTVVSHPRAVPGVPTTRTYTYGSAQLHPHPTRRAKEPCHALIDQQGALGLCAKISPLLGTVGADGADEAPSLHNPLSYAPCDAKQRK